MKKALIPVLCLFSFAGFAQNGFFEEPEFGLGFSNIKSTNPPADLNTLYGLNGLGWQSRPQSVFTYNPSILLGYRLGNWSVSTGISFLKTGYKSDNLAFLANSNIGDKMTENYYHIIIPLIFTDNFKLGKHLFISPSVGCALSYNTPSKIEYTSADGTAKAYIQDTTFSSTYFRVTGWCILQVQMGYKVNNQMSILIGPEYQFMLTSFLKDNDNAQVNRAYTINVGLTWHLITRKEEAGPQLPPAPEQPNTGGK